MSMKRQHRGVLYGGIVGVAISAVLAFSATTLTGFEPGALVILLIVAMPFLLGLAPLWIAMPDVVARVVWVVAALLAIPLGLLLLWTGAFVVYIPLALVYFHAAATADSASEAELNTDPVQGS